MILQQSKASGVMNGSASLDFFPQTTRSLVVLHVVCTLSVCSRAATLSHV